MLPKFGICYINLLVQSRIFDLKACPFGQAFLLTAIATYVRFHLCVLEALVGLAIFVKLHLAGETVILKANHCLYEFFIVDFLGVKAHLLKSRLDYIDAVVAVCGELVGLCVVSFLILLYEVLNSLVGVCCDEGSEVNSAFNKLLSSWS